MLEPVEVVWERRCTFKAKTCGLCDLPKSNRVHTPKKTATCQFRRRNGCATCGLAKGHPDHFGAPQSVNVYGSGDPAVYQRLKQQMEALITEALEASDLPRPCASIIVRCAMTFPDTTGRDEGNLRGPLEKALGDALTTGGWLVGDTFYPVRRFTFDGIDPSYEPGVLRTRLLLFPSLDEPASVAAPAEPAPALFDA